MLKKLMKSLPLRLALCILFAYLFGNQLSEPTIRFLFTISCVLKEILMTVLPVMIFSYIFAAIVSLEKNAPVLIVFILVMVVLSNALVTFTSYGIGATILPLITMSEGGVIALNSKMTSYFSLGIPQIISSNKAMISGLILGLIFCYLKMPKVSKFADKLQNLVNLFLKKCFIPVLPLYVLGFVLKMQYEGELSILLQNYAQVFILICISLIAYIFLMYFIGSGCSWKKCKQSLKNMAPAGLTGFSTISSAVPVPLSIVATEQNTQDKQFSRLIIPATVNIHMIGHGVSIPITALTILMLSGQPIPSLETFAIFVMYFCIAKFSATAVPGGGIIVILPFLQSKLGFTPEMSSIIIMLDILQDAILTIGNVMGNGGLAIIAHRVQKMLKITK
ncbi:MAG: dicarboxylate/amino acid:cation symporter [Rickettsiales bacterium]|jgi:Na+/H+-dicarboxylate symporter|nr:dicarboxylate/amino acid:cation symporter [Rickettsiales bacterium]